MTFKAIQSEKEQERSPSQPFFLTLLAFVRQLSQYTELSSLSFIAAVIMGLTLRRFQQWTVLTNLSIYIFTPLAIVIGKLSTLP